MNLARFAFTASCLLLYSRASAQPRSYVNPQMANAYLNAVEKMAKSPDKAAASLESLKKQDLGNALPIYLQAAVSAHKEDWPGCLKLVREGNAASRCVLYVVEEGPLRRFDAFGALRQMAKECAAATNRLGLQKAPELLREIDVMGKRVARGLPKDPVTVVAGTSIRGIAQGALVDLYDTAQLRAESDKARASRAHLRQWSERSLRLFAEAVGKKGKLNPALLIRKYKLTRKELQAYTTGRSKSPATRRKLIAMTQEAEQLQRPIVEKALKEMPE